MKAKIILNDKVVFESELNPLPKTGEEIRFFPEPSNEATVTVDKVVHVLSARSDRHFIELHVK